MAQQLRTLTSLSEDPGQLTVPTWQFTTITPVPGDLTSSHRHMNRQNINAHKIKTHTYIHTSLEFARIIQPPEMLRALT